MLSSSQMADRFELSRHGEAARTWSQTGSQSRVGQFERRY